MFIDIEFIILGVIILGAAFFFLYREYRSMTGSRQRPDASTGYKPSVRPAETVYDQQPMTFKGEGSGVTDSVYLNSALYRIEYQFPHMGKFSVDLISADGGVRKSVVADKSGFAFSSFQVPSSRYYLFQVTSSEGAGSWALVVKPF
jgi:hypothetical protein